MTLREFMDEHEGEFIYVGTTKAAGWLLIGNITAEDVENAAQEVNKRRIQTSGYNVNTVKHKLSHATGKSKIKNKEALKKEYARKLDRAKELVEYWETKSTEVFIDREVVDSYERSGADGYPGIAVIVEGAESNGYWDFIEQETKCHAGGIYCAGKYC